MAAPIDQYRTRPGAHDDMPTVDGSVGGLYRVQLLAERRFQGHVGASRTDPGSEPAAGRDQSQPCPGAPLRMGPRDGEGQQ